MYFPFIIFLFINFIAIYGISKNWKRATSLVNTKAIILSILFHLLFSIFYYYNSIRFQNFNSYSFGSDSLIYQKILEDLIKDGLQSTLVQNYISDGKITHVFLYQPIGSILGINTLSAYVIILQNILLLFSSYFFLFGYIKKKISNQGITIKQINTAKAVSLILLFLPVSFITPVSFLRESLILFSTTTVLYFLNYKKRIIPYILLPIILLILAYLRSMYVYLFALGITANHLISINSHKKKYIITILAIVVLFLIPKEYISQFFIGIFRRLLFLQDADIGSLGKNSYLAINTDILYSKNFSVLSVFNIFVTRFIIGSIRFILTPLFASSLIDLTMPPTLFSFYKGMEVKIIDIFSAFQYNFFLLPLSIGALYNFIKNKSIKYDASLLLLLIYILGTIAVYGVKFLGDRNMRIDLIYQPLLILFIACYGSKKSVFYAVILFMIALNLVYLILKSKGA